MLGFGKRSKHISFEEIEIDKVRFRLNPLTAVQTLALSRGYLKRGFFDFCVDALSVMTTLSPAEIMGINIQTAISLMAYHRVYFWGNEPVSESPELKATDFLRIDKGRYKEEYTSIGGVRFSNLITVGSAIGAEKLCALRNDLEYLTFYLMSAGCSKGGDAGIKAVLTEAIDCIEYREGITELNRKIGKVGMICIDLLQGSESLSVQSSDGSSFLNIDGSSFFLASVSRNT